MSSIYRCILTERSQTLEIDIFQGTPDLGTIVNVPPEALMIGNWDRGYDKYPVGLRQAESLEVEIDLNLCDTDLCEILEVPTSTIYNKVAILTPSQPIYYPPQRGTVWVVKSKMYVDGVLSTDYKVRNVFVQKQGIADEYSPYEDKLKTTLADIRRDCLEQISFEDIATWMAYSCDGARYSTRAAWDYYYYELPEKHFGAVQFTTDHYMHFYPIQWFEFTIYTLYKKHLNYYGVLNNYIDEATVQVQLPHRVWVYRIQLPIAPAVVGREIDFGELYACFFLTENDSAPDWAGEVGTDSVGGFLIGKGSIGEQYKNVYDYLNKEYEGCLAKDFDGHYPWNVTAVPVLHGTGDAMKRENASDKDIKFKKQGTVINKAKYGTYDTYEEAYNEEFTAEINRSYLESSSDAMIHLHNLPIACNMEKVPDLPLLYRIEKSNWNSNNLKLLPEFWKVMADYLPSAGGLNGGVVKYAKREVRYGLYVKQDRPFFKDDTMTRVHECCAIKWNEDKTSVGDYPDTSGGEIPINAIARPVTAEVDFQALSIEVQNGQNMLSVAAKARLLLFGSAAQALVETKELMDGYTAEYIDTITSETYNELVVKEGNTVGINVEDYARSRFGRVSSSNELQNVCTVVSQKENITDGTFEMQLLTQGVEYA